jgi:thiol-disulfide isomerase/thioredoxin
MVALMVTPSHSPDQSGHSPWRIRPPVLITGLILIAVFAAGWWLTRPGDATDASPLDQAVDLSSLAGNAPVALDPAPDFAVPARDGGDFILSDHLATGGRPVFLNLWASWCLPCRAEMPAIDDAARRHTDVSFVGIAVKDDESEARAFADEIGIGYIIGFDVREQVNALYPALGLPATFLIDTDGNIVDTYIGTLNDQVIDDLVAQF